MDLVCPECGGADFLQDRPAVIRFTMRYSMYAKNGCWTDAAEETMDTDRDGEITCAECGNEAVDGELITKETYNESVDDDDW